MESPLDTLEVRRLRPVTFRYPDDITYRYDLADEVGVYTPYTDIGEYVYLLQLLHGRDGQEDAIRAAYYRKGPLKDRWYFAGQFSLTAERDSWLRLLTEALKKDWFRSLIDEAIIQADAPTKH